MSQIPAASSVAPGRVTPDHLDVADVGDSEETARSTEFISFAIGDQQYGIDIMAVREIKGWSDITRLPKQPDYVCGVLNLRGVLIPIIDLRCRFSQGLTEPDPMHVIIVVQVDAKTVGLLADRVLDIIAVEASHIQPVPQVSRSIRADFIAGLVTVETSMIALIDLPALLSAETLHQTRASGVSLSRPAETAVVAASANLTL